MLYKMRITREITAIEKEPVDNVSVSINKDDIMNWTAIIIGPNDTPYEGGLFKINIYFTDEYPIKPPILKFKTPIYHPNINPTSGAICIDILKNNWSPALTIQKVLLSVVSLLNEPNSDDPLVPDVANIYKTNIELFNANASEWTNKYAF